LFTVVVVVCVAVTVVVVVEWSPDTTTTSTVWVLSLIGSPSPHPLLLHPRTLSANAGATTVANKIALTTSTETIRLITLSPFSRIPTNGAGCLVALPFKEASGPLRSHPSLTSGHHPLCLLSPNTNRPRDSSEPLVAAAPLTCSAQSAHLVSGDLSLCLVAGFSCGATYITIPHLLKVATETPRQGRSETVRS
jgi:hypothetical protein